MANVIRPFVGPVYAVTPADIIEAKLPRLPEICYIQSYLVSKPYPLFANEKLVGFSDVLSAGMIVADIPSYEESAAMLSVSQNHIISYLFHTAEPEFYTENAVLLDVQINHILDYVKVDAEPETYTESAAMVSVVINYIQGYVYLDAPPAFITDSIDCISATLTPV